MYIQLIKKELYNSLVFAGSTAHTTMNLGNQQIHLTKNDIQFMIPYTFNLMKYQLDHQISEY